MSTSVLFSTVHPYPSISIQTPPGTLFSELPELIESRYPILPITKLNISTHIGTLPSPCSLVSSLAQNGSNLVTLRLTPLLIGGKGGFGSQLRAAGGRMSSQKTSNNDSCRDLSGRRLSTVKEGKKLAAYLEAEPVRKKAAAEVAKAKLEQLERQLASSEELAEGKKRRFEDTEYLEQSREIVENVKSAVSIGLLKKRKKAKMAPKVEEEPAVETESNVEPVAEVVT